MGKKYRYVLNLEKYGISDKNINAIYDEIKKRGGKDKEIVDAVKKEFDEYIKKQFDISPNEIGLYTILIDGAPLSSKEEYKEAVVREKTNSVKGGIKKKGEGRKYCSICQSTENVTQDFSKTKIKFYTTNQIIFASELGNYDKNMLLCQDCLNKLIAGETFIMNNLNTRLAKFYVYLIPHFIYESPMTVEDLNKIASKISSSFNTVKNIKNVGEARDYIEGILDDPEEENYFTINMMFYKTSQKATKVQRLIKDVNPSIFMEIADASYFAYSLGNDAIYKTYNREFSLENIYYLTPIREKSNEALQYNNLLNIYDAIFSKRKLSRDVIINNILEVTKIQYLEKQGYNVGSGLINFTILDGNLYIKFLEYLGCLREGKTMDTSDLKVGSDIKNYIEKMGYDEQEAAMFLLGYLVGQVGNAQVKKSDEKKKPILNKLNFNGIDKSKIIRLSSDVFNKLRQEKILVYNEVVHSEYRRLLDQNIDTWNLDKHENLFYILSGYGYATTKPMLIKKENGGNENE